MSINAEDLLKLINRAKKEVTPVPPGKAPAENGEAIAVPGSEDLAEMMGELQRDEELLQRILGLLYREKKAKPISGYVGIIELEKRLGLAREAGTFTLNYMKTKHLIEPDDKSRVAITVEGVDYLRDVLQKRLA